METIQERVARDWKEAMKAKDKRKDALSMILTELKNRAIRDNQPQAQARVVNDEVALEVLARMAKQRTESIDSFTAAQRMDLADKETFELEVVRSYLPKPLSETEIEAVLRQAIEEVGAQSKKDLGKVMGKVLPQLKGRADGKIVQAMLTEKLQQLEQGK